MNQNEFKNSHKQVKKKLNNLNVTADNQPNANQKKKKGR